MCFNLHLILFDIMTCQYDCCRRLVFDIAGYFPHSSYTTKSRQRTRHPTEMLSNKENIADVQVQQIPPKASPRDSSKEEGMRVQSEDGSVHAGTQVPLGTRNT